MKKPLPRRLLAKWGDAADIALTIALPVSTQLSRWTGAGKSEVERAREFEGAVSPPAATFAIWAPIFAGLTTQALIAATQGRSSSATSAAALLRASLIGNLLWNLNAQFKDFGWQSVALIGASAVSATASVASYERTGKREEASRTAAQLVGPLAGWLSVATFANVETTQRFTKSASRSWLTPKVLVGAVVFAAAAGISATRANAGYALAAGIGLGGIAVKNRREKPRVALVAAAGLIALSALVVAVRRRR